MKDRLATEGKLCFTCDEVKPSSSFYRRSISKDGLTARCKACLSRLYKTYASKTKEYHARMRQKYKKTQRRSMLKRRYGLTIERYEEMLLRQGNVCLICGLAEKRIIKGTRSSLLVDHCHETGRVRGLLCDSCNVGISRFRDSPELLRRAADYLSKDIYVPIQKGDTECLNL